MKDYGREFVNYLKAIFSGSEVGFSISGGTTSKTLTVTADTSLDEAVAMSSKTPKADPEFSGIVSNLGGSPDGGLREFVVFTVSLDTTIAITLTYQAGTGRHGHVLEILAAISDTAASNNYSSIVRYAVVAFNTSTAAVVTDMTHDLVGGVSEGVSVSNNVVTVTLTVPTAADEVCIYVRDIGGGNYGRLGTVTVA